MFLALKTVGRGAVRRSSSKKEKKQNQKHFLAYEEFSIYEIHNVTRALIDPVVPRGGNKPLMEGESLVEC